VNVELPLTGCGSHIFLTAGSNVTLESPFYPQVLHPGTLCKWTYSTNTSYAFEIIVNDLESNDVIEGRCSGSYLGINSTQHLDLKLCAMPETALKTRANDLELLYVTRGRSGGKFSLHIKTVGNYITI